MKPLCFFLLASIVFVVRVCMVLGIEEGSSERLLDGKQLKVWARPT